MKQSQEVAVTTVPLRGFSTTAGWAGREILRMPLSFRQSQRTLAAVRSMIPRLVTNGVVVADEPTLYTDPSNIPAVLAFLRDHTATRCKALMDITAIDVPMREKRFEVRMPYLTAAAPRVA